VLYPTERNIGLPSCRALAKASSPQGYQSTCIVGVKPVVYQYIEKLEKKFNHIKNTANNFSQDYGHAATSKATLR
jgi:hypothetical protein